MSYIGVELILKMLRSPGSAANSKLRSEFFEKEDDERLLWQFVTEHRSKYGCNPSIETLESSGLSICDTPEPYAYYFDRVVSRYTHQRLAVTRITLDQHLKAGSTEDAFKLVRESVFELSSISQESKLMELTSDAKEVYQTYYAQKNSGLITPILLGWQTLDGMNGGLIPSDVFSVIGRPGMGKTFAILYSAMTMWATQKKRVLFVSMEMPNEAILARALGIYTRINSTHVKNAELSDYELKKLSGGLDLISSYDVPFWVLDGNLSGTIPDIFGLCDSLKVDAVFIDGAYLVKHANHRLNKYERVAENAELIKQMSSISKVPSLCSWQFNREASKKKKNPEQLGLEDIGSSDVIGQVSSVVIALLEEELTELEQMKHRQVHILKGRNGERGRFTINWRFDTGHMDFSEVSEVELEMENL